MNISVFLLKNLFFYLIFIYITYISFGSNIGLAVKFLISPNFFGYQNIYCKNGQFIKLLSSFENYITEMIL